MSSEGQITLKEAAAQYGRSEATMSRLVRRLGLTVLVNPEDRRSRLVDLSELDHALSRSGPLKEPGELRIAFRSALERARQGRMELESSRRKLIRIADALAEVRGEGPDDGLR